MIETLISQLTVAVPSIIVGTQTLTSVINGLFGVDNKKWRHAISWIVSVIVALFFVAFDGLSFGLSAVWKEYVAGVFAGILAGGAANGFYDWNAIGSIFSAIENAIRKKKVKQLND